MALNIGATVATNMMIQGEDYSLTSLRNDVLGGVLGGLGGKLGEEIVGAVASTVTKGSASATIQAAEKAGLSTAVLAKEAATFTVTAAEQSLVVGLAKEGGNLLGGAAGSTIATGENGFTIEGLAQGAFMNIVGKFAPGARRPGTGRPRRVDRRGRRARTDAHPDRRRGARAAGERRGSGPARHARGAGASRRGRGRRPAGEEARRPGVDEGPALAAGERTSEAGSGGGEGPTRPGSARERLEARRLVNAVEVLGSQWPGMNQAERMSHAVRHRLPRARGARRPAGGVHRRAVLARQRRGVRLPDVEGQGRSGVHPGADTLDPRMVAMVSDISRHEVDHALQWWAMARMRAAQGEGAVEITVSMDGVPKSIAERAVEAFKRDGMSKAEIAAAEVWWTSIYGTAKPARDAGLDARKQSRKRLAELDAQIKALEDAGGQPHASVVAERDQLRLAVAGFDQFYRGLPEEVAAYETGGIVAAEARVLEAERQVDLARVARDEARSSLQGIEDRFFPQVRAGNPDPALSVDHDRALARMRRMETQLDAAQAESNAAERAAQGIRAADAQTVPGGTDPGGGGGGTGGGGGGTGGPVAAVAEAPVAEAAAAERPAPRPRRAPRPGAERRRRTAPRRRATPTTHAARRSSTPRPTPPRTRASSSRARRPGCPDRTRQAPGRRTATMRPRPRAPATAGCRRATTPSPARARRPSAVRASRRRRPSMARRRWRRSTRPAGPRRATSARGSTRRRSSCSITPPRRRTCSSP